MALKQKLKELRYAFIAWKDSPLLSCCESPFHPGHYDRQGNPLPYTSVCNRERAWRDYIGLRDALIEKDKYSINDKDKNLPPSFFM